MNAPPWPLPGGRFQVIVAELQQHTPGVCVWFGVQTLHWWAMVPWLDHLLEAADPETLRRMLTEAMWYRPRRPAHHRPVPPAHHAHDGSWTSAPPPSPPDPDFWAEDTPRRRAAPPRTGLAAWVRLGRSVVAAVAR